MESEIGHKWRGIWFYVSVSFDLPVFTVELRGDLGTGEQGLVDLSFRDFIVHYDKSHRYETHIQVSASKVIGRIKCMTHFLSDFRHGSQPVPSTSDPHNLSPEDLF
jgi:hypothetical protein